MLQQTIETSWGKKQELTAPEIRQYFAYQDSLTNDNGSVMFGNRVVVPTGLRGEVRNTLHETHLGATIVKQLARDSVFWPNINRQLEERVS